MQGALESIGVENLVGKDTYSTHHEGEVLVSFSSPNFENFEIVETSFNDSREQMMGSNHYMII